MNDEAANPGPLHGIRVLEFGQLIAGPFCGQLLGDLGADVVKVEDPAQGDPMRRWGAQRDGKGPVHWSVLGRNKRSVAIDLRGAPGQAVAAQLASGVDVVIENFRPGTMERWGLGYEQVSKDNPGVIFVRVTGFGQTGPYASRAGYGSIGEAMGGLRNLLGEPDRPPSRAGLSIGDSLAGSFGALGAMAALIERQRSGRGQVVDCAIFESVLAMTESLVSDYAALGHVRERTGAVLPGVAPSNAYATKDGGTVLVAANQDTVFGRLAQAMGRPELAHDPAYATHAARGRNQEQLDRVVGAWTETLTWKELEATCAESGVPAGLVYRAPEMISDPHFAARRSLVEVGAGESRVLMQNVFPRLSRTPGSVRWAGGELGDSTRDVLREAGLGAGRIDDLIRDGVVR